VVNLHLQSLNTSWDAYPDAFHTLDDILLDKVQNAIEIQKNNSLTVNESPLSFLLKNDLIREEKPVNAAYLMFKNRDSIDTSIELGRFKTAITILDSARTQADIITQVNQVLDFVRKHINVEIIITGEPQNTQKWQYPMEAIREIVINMIIHREYRAISDSVVKIFDDKIEFYNPGKLPEDITIDDLLSGNYKSTPRNRKIADFFKNMGWIEKYGSGIGRICDYFRKYGLPEPEFKAISEGFQVTTFGRKIADDMKIDSQIQENVQENVQEKRIIALLKLLEENNQLSLGKMAKILNVSSKTIQRDLDMLKKRKLISREGHYKGGFWKIIN
jgi:ATP-dependent DNA helicase RecG